MSGFQVFFALVFRRFMALAAVVFPPPVTLDPTILQAAWRRRRYLGLPLFLKVFILR